MSSPQPGILNTPLPQSSPAFANKRIVNDPQKEYIVVQGYSSNIFKTLAATLDDVEVEIDLATYDRMENDSTITKAKTILVTNVLSDELEMTQGRTEDEVSAQEFDTFTAVMEFCQRMVSGTDRPFRETLEQLLGNSITYGHGIAEIVWEYREDGQSKPAPEPTVGTATNPKPKASIWSRMNVFAATPTSDPLIRKPILDGTKTRLMPKSVKVKPRGSVRFVVDDFMNVIGMAPRSRGRFGSLAPEIKWNEIIDREKFMVFTRNRKDEDPRGKSAYRPAFNWYNIKSQVPAELLRFILEESVPKAVGTLPENPIPYEAMRDNMGNIVYEPDGTTPKMQTAAETFADQIEGFRSGSGAVIPFGAKLEPYKKTVETDANLFPTLVKLIDDQIENCILLQTLAQSEGSHQARSAAQQVAELLYNLVFWTKWGLAQTIIYDFLSIGVKNNFGEWALAYLPKISLGDFVRRDWVEEVLAYADGYFKGLFDDTQRPEIMANLNMPKPGPSRAELSADALANQASQDVNGNPGANPNQRPDKQPGSKDRNKGNGKVKKNDTTKNAVTGSGFNNPLGHHSRWFGRA